MISKCIEISFWFLPNCASKSFSLLMTNSSGVCIFYLFHTLDPQIKLNYPVIHHINDIYIVKDDGGVFRMKWSLCLCALGKIGQLCHPEKHKWGPVTNRSSMVAPDTRTDKLSWHCAQMNRMSLRNGLYSIPPPSKDTCTRHSLKVIHCAWITMICCWTTTDPMSLWGKHILTYLDHPTKRPENEVS